MSRALADRPASGALGGGARDRTSILVVEDAKEVANVCAQVLGYAGAEVRIAHSIRDAIAALRLAIPDVIVADVHLPDGKCFELRDALAELAPGANVPMVAMSGHDREAACLESGIEAYCQKPFTFDALVDAVGRARKRRVPTDLSRV